MSGYHYARKVTVTNDPEPLQRGLRWSSRKRDGKPPYMVRSDAGGMSTRHDHIDTLTEARKVARERAKACGWAEIFRWAENGVMIRKFFIASYEREIQA